MRPLLTRSGSQSKRSRGQQLVIFLSVGLPILIGCMLLYSTRFLTSHNSETAATMQSSNAQNGPLKSSKQRGVESGELISKTSGGVEYHIVFSTGCTLYQDWQSYVFFYQAKVSKQPGTVTRIVSGCEDKEAETKMQSIFDEEIHPMSPEGRFKIHFTPDYSKLENGKSYVYFNKPFGMKHWLENALGHPKNPVNEDAIIILLDPDQLIMRPFTNNDFTNTEWKFLDKNEIPRTRIEHGKPMGQLYGFGLQWTTKINMTAIAPNSPVDKLSSKDAQKGYIVGPPYVATARDMYTIVGTWCAFAHRVHDQYPHLLAEMFAYCLAAAHEQLPHQTAASFMISDAGAGRSEGWSYIDRMPDAHVCGGFSVDEVPNVLHFCQRYGMGDYFFGKRKLPHDFLSCASPLLKEPPSDVLSKYNYAIFPNNNKKMWTPQMAKENAFTICFMIKALNAAAEHYKRQHCDVETAIFDKELLLSLGEPGS